VVIDGLYSWEEFKYLKDHYGPEMATVSVLASPATRHRRLSSRAVRPLKKNEALKRDDTEIQNLNKGGPIAIADFNIINEGPLSELNRKVEFVLSKIGGKA
jgi:dephospho-CoA kinase